MDSLLNMKYRLYTCSCRVCRFYNRLKKVEPPLRNHLQASSKWKLHEWRRPLTWSSLKIRIHVIFCRNITLKCGRSGITDTQSVIPYLRLYSPSSHFKDKSKIDWVYKNKRTLFWEGQKVAAAAYIGWPSDRGCIYNIMLFYNYFGTLMTALLIEVQL